MRNFTLRISPAPEEFQHRMDIAVEGLTETEAIANDILVFGCGATDEAVILDYNKKNARLSSTDATAKVLN